jgi:nucleotide-binding universal stress UspA family protein
MRRILVATDRTDGAHDALGRAVAMAGASRAELRVVSAMPRGTDQDACQISRAELRDEIASFPGAPGTFDLDLSLRMPWKQPVEAILAEAAEFNPDLIILGAHGSPRLRDVVFGTTASRVAREADHPVLIVQNEHQRPYETLLVAIDDHSGEEVLRVALGIETVKDIYVVHACGSVGQSLFGGGEAIDVVRDDQEVMTRDLAELGRTFGLSSAAPKLHNIVEDGEPLDVIMRAWKRVEPDLLVMGTEGRAGLARLLRASHAETAILGCTSDILVARTHASG